MFYITLPSNSSMEFYPGNTVTHFYTKLNKTIKLDSNEWEVALVEAQIPISWFNVRQDECWFVIFEIDRELGENITHRGQLPAGLYQNTPALIKQLNEVISNLNDSVRATKFTFDNASMKASVRVYKDNLSLRMSIGLCRLLGMEDIEITNKQVHTSNQVIDTSLGQCSIYVYCDIIEPRHVGDTLAPLLRVIPIEGRRRLVHHIIYNTPHYLPLIKSQFDTIEILLTDDQGRKIPFEFGKSLMTLHFRRRQLH